MKRKGKWNRFFACMLAVVLCVTTINTNAFLLEVHAENTESVSQNDSSAEAPLEQLPDLNENEPIAEWTDDEVVVEQSQDESCENPVIVPQEEAIINMNAGAGEDGAEVAYSACMVTLEEARLAAVDGVYPEMVSDEAWVGADTLDGIFEQVASKWEDGTVSENGIEVPYTGWLFISVNKPVEESTVIIPEMINEQSLHGVVIWSYDQTLSFDGVTINNSNICLRGGIIEGDLPLDFTYATSGSYDVRLEDVTVNGSIYACDADGNAVEDATGELTFGYNVTLGGIYDIEKVRFISDVRVANVENADKVEFYQVETNNHGVTLAFEGYRPEKIPQFNSGVSRDEDNWQRANEYGMVVENDTKYPVTWYQDTMYLKMDENYYRVWEYNQAVCLDGNGPVGEGETYFDETGEEKNLVASLAEAFENPDMEKYLADGNELPLFRFYDKEGNETYYLDKIGYLYQATDTTTDDLRNSNLFIIEQEGKTIEEVEATYYDAGGYGGLAECPNITVRYITEDSFYGEWVDVALTYETFVINYITPGVLQEMEDFSYWQERWDDDYNANDAYVDVDGCVYNRNKAVAYIERFEPGTVTDEETGEQITLATAAVSFEQYGRGNYCTEGIDREFASTQNAVIAMRNDAATQGGGCYYHLQLRENAENVKLLIKSNDIMGIAVGADWIGESEESQPNRIVIKSIKAGKNATTIKLVGIYAGDERENVAEPANLSISGAGKVVFMDCKINQNVNSESNIDLLGSNTMKSLTMSEGTTLHYAEGGIVLGIEDFMDISAATVIGEGGIRLAARKDARVILGEMSTLTEFTVSNNTLSGDASSNELPAGNNIDFYAETDNGVSTDIVLTKDFAIGYQTNLDNPEDVYESGFNISMVDANHTNCVFSNSMYGIDSCFWIETEEYNNQNFDDCYNFVEYDANMQQRILTIDKSLHDAESVDKQALLGKIHAVYKQSVDDDYGEVAYHNMGGMLNYIAEVDNPFAGKEAFKEEGNELHYTMYRWVWNDTDTYEDDVLFDTNKYVTVLKECDISKAKISTIPEQIYTGEELTPSVTVSLNNTELVKDKDYVIAYANNINPGTATITITGINNYSGESSASFVIKKKTESESTKPQPHTHTKGDWIIEKDATGSQTGIKVQKCTQCGEVLATETIPKYKVVLNAKKIPLQVGKSTTAIKATVMEGDKVVSWKTSNKKNSNRIQKRKDYRKESWKSHDYSDY